ncbi:MAG: hypothetical protein ACRC35_10595 [Angustibacter sp.]
MDAVLVLAPTAGVLFLFIIAVRAMLEGDRRERSAQARWERERGREASGNNGDSPS